MNLKIILAAALGTVWAGAVQAEINVKIGVLNDQSGGYADIAGPGSVIAARMAVEDFKAKEKGINATVVAGDHQNKPDVGSGIARKWYDNEDVDVIVDVPTSSVALAVNQITKDKNKIFLVSGAGTSDLTGKACSPNTIHWSFDTYALSRSTGGAMVKAGGDTWFFLTSDYAFGHALERDAEAFVVAAGGKVVGKVRHPFPAQDFSSFLIQAQGSKAKVIGLANAGSDTINSLKQAKEFGIVQGGQKLAGLLVFSSDVQSVGLDVAQGLVLTEPYFSDLNDDTRDFAKRFGEKFQGKVPTSVQAGTYSAVLHYLKAVAAAQSKEAGTVLAKMKALPTNDPVFGPGSIRPDGRKLHSMYLLEVKSPAEAKNKNDIYKLIATIPADDAFRPMSEGGCPYVSKN